MTRVLYYEDGCQDRFLTRFEESNSTLLQTSGLCEISRADVLGSTYTFFQVLGLSWTVPALLFSYYVLCSRVKPLMKQVQTLADFKTVVLSRIEILLLLNASCGLLGQFLWSVDPDFARYTLGNVVVAFFRQVSPMALFNGGVLYLFTFQSTLNSLYSQSSHKEKYFAMISSGSFVICMIIDAFFDIAGKKTAVPELLWATGFFVFQIAVVFYGIRVAWKFFKTSVGISDARRSSARPVIVKLLIVIVGLTVIGSGFFWTMARYGWMTVLNPDEPPFGSISGKTAEEVRGRFTFLVGLYNTVGIVIVPLFYSTFISFTCCTKRKSKRIAASKCTENQARKSGVRSTPDVELGGAAAAKKLPETGHESHDIPETERGDPTTETTTAAS